MEGRFKVEGASEIAAQARRARRQMDVGQTLVLRDFADIWREGEDVVFQTHGASIGASWKPLAASTQKQRGRLDKRFGLGIGPSDPRLVLFGDLRDALRKKGGAQEQSISGSSLRIAVETSQINRHNRATGLGMTLTKSGRRRKPRGRGGSRYPDDIIEIHEKGTARIPARPMIGISRETEAALDRRAERFFDSLMRTIAGD